MIFSSFHTNDSFSEYPAAIQRALDYLRRTDITAMEPGDYPIEGRKMYAKVFDCATKPAEEIRCEVHRQYIDIQFWASGSERFGIAHYTGSETVIEANESSDLYFLDAARDESFVAARPGSFAVFFPWDVHRPGAILDAPETVRKCVVKVHMDLLKG